MAMVLEGEPRSPRPESSEHAAIDDEGPSPQIQGAGPTERVRQHRILVVDDNAALRETVVEMLSTQGYVVAEAADGEAGLRHLASAPTDVLVLDLHMPGLAGIELLRQIEPPPPIVIVCSAFEYVSPAELREQAGPKVFRSLRKPVPPITLIAVVAEAINELKRGAPGS